MTDAFAEHVRSASFSLSLSAGQIDYLLTRAKIEELERKYPWYSGASEANFGDLAGLDAASYWTTATVRALVRRGLVTVAPQPLPTTEAEVVKLTRAGRILIDLLVEAGFEVSPRSVPPVHRHPDDRAAIRPAADSLDLEMIPSPGDRRLPCEPADEPFLAKPLGVIGAPA